MRPTECGCERLAYGDFLTSVGRVEEAVEQYQRAQAMMPLSPIVSVRLAHALFVSGRNDEAGRITAEMLDIWPDATLLKLVKLKSAFWTHRYDEALAILEEPGLHLTNSQATALTAAFEALRSNDPAARAAAADTLQTIAADPRRNDRMLVAALAALGAGASALDAARRLIEARGPMAADVLFDPNLAAASRTPQYAALVNQLGLAHYWQSSSAVPDNLPAAGYAGLLQSRLRRTIMRAAAGLLALMLSACAPEGETQSEPAARPAAAALDIPAAVNRPLAQSSPLMAMPENKEALKRLEAMGYTIHADHLHAPGVTACPKMGDGPVM